MVHVHSRCRWNYSLMEEKRPGQFFPVEEDGRGTYLYNSKDMCMIEHVPELIEAGITSFKIEGRNKTAYYAACVTGAYRAAIDTYKKDPENFVLPQFCRDEVNKVSHREYYTGFYFGNQENGQHYGDSQYIREYEVVGMPVECDDSGKAVFALKNRFFDGEELELIQPGQAPYVFRAENVTDDEGTKRELFNVPQMRVHFAFPFKVSEWAILRKVKDGQSKQTDEEVRRQEFFCLQFSRGQHSVRPFSLSVAGPLGRAHTVRPLRKTFIIVHSYLLTPAS